MRDGSTTAVLLIHYILLDYCFIPSDIIHKICWIPKTTSPKILLLHLRKLLKYSSSNYSSKNLCDFWFTSYSDVYLKMYMVRIKSYLLYRQVIISRNDTNHIMHKHSDFGIIKHLVAIFYLEHCMTPRISYARACSY